MSTVDPAIARRRQTPLAHGQHVPGVLTELFDTGVSPGDEARIVVGFGSEEDAQIEERLARR